MANSEPLATLTARSAGLIGCKRCLGASPGDAQHCVHCGNAIASRDPTSLQRVWAWWITGLICYIPANMYPMLSTRTLLTTNEATIVSGAIELYQHGSYGIAAIILMASMVIPISKFAAIAYLAWQVGHPRASSSHGRQILYEAVEHIGRWSMVDVFVVAILASLVQLGSAASITAGVASLTFAMSVMFTMLSAQAFDSRLIWDQLPAKETQTHA
jgi:paraquat-inducible protein A